ncbi:MAG: DUF805 domain-containing protein [bacterium]
MNWYIAVLKKYAVFSERASRSEFWFFVLFSFIVSIVITIVEGIAGTGGIIGMVYNLAVLLPSLGVAIRRIHDSGKTGWFYLVPFYNLYLLIIDGTQGENKYGPRPTATAPKMDMAEDKKEEKKAE